MKHILFLALFGSAILCFCQQKPDKQRDSVQRPSSARHYFDSLEKALEDANHKDRFGMQLQLFGNYLYSDSGKAVFYLNKCLGQAAVSGDSLWIVQSSNGKGWMLRNRGDLKESIRTFEYALEIAKRNNFKTQVKYLLNQLALSYTESASYDKALHYNLESLRVREIEGDSTDISIALSNIAFVYAEIGDNENALRYYRKSYQTKVRSNLRYDLERTLKNIGDILIELGKYEEAEQIVKRASTICDSAACSNDILLEVYQTFGVALFKQNKKFESEKYFNESLKLAQALGLSKEIAINFYWLAAVKFYSNRIDSAIIFLDRSHGITLKYDMPKVMLGNYLLYADIYSHEKDYKKALEFHRLYDQLNSEILNNDLTRKVSRIQFDYEQRENTSRLVSQAKMMAIQKESLQRQRILIVSIGIAAILAMALTMVLYKINRNKQRVNDILDQRVKERTSELEINRDELKHAHDQQIILINKLSGDLASSLATLKGLSITASVDLPQEQRVYFDELEATAEKLVNQVNKYSLPS